MEGYKTYTGVILTIIGMTHLGSVFGNDAINNFVNVGAEFIGAILALYGNYKAHQKIANLQG